MEEGTASKSDINISGLQPAKHVELAPGVIALRPEEGLVNLGIPVGTDAYVRAEAVRTIEGHDEQPRGGLGQDRVAKVGQNAADRRAGCSTTSPITMTE